MVTLHDRRDYWVHTNGKIVDLQETDGVISVSDGQPITQEDLEAIPESEVLKYLAAEKITLLELEIDDLCRGHVSCHIDPEEKAHWMGMADAIARKQSLWLGDGGVNPETFPQPTADEYTLWSNLATIQKLTANCRNAASSIANSLYTMTSEEINALPADWASTHILWP